HSVGEYVAAALAGVFDLREALGLVAARGRLIQDLPGGAMLAVRLPEEKLAPLLSSDTSIAAVNAPQLCVAAGPQEAIAALEAKLLAQDVVARRLRTSHAFHSAMMDPALPAFAERVAQVPLKAPSIPIVSTC